MESKKSVGDIKKRFEVLHEINSNSAASGVHSPSLESSKVSSHIPKPSESNAGVHIKRTPAFRCDKGNKKVNHVLKSNKFNNELNNIIDQSVKKYDLSVSGKTGVKNQTKNDTKPNTNGYGKVCSISRRNHVSSHPDIKSRVNDSYSCVVPKKPDIQVKLNDNHLFAVPKQPHPNIYDKPTKEGIKHVDNKVLDNYATPIKKPTRPNYLPLAKSSSRKTNHSHSESSDSNNDVGFHPDLRQVLSSPLPSGPPPKKPPRTFAHNLKYSPDNEFNSQEVCSVKSNTNAPLSLPSSTMRPIRSKTESQIMLKKLENVLKQHPNLSNESTIRENPSKSKPPEKGSKDPTKRYGLCLALQESERLMVSLSCNKITKEEPVYADVSQTINKKKNSTVQKQGLHYMVSFLHYPGEGLNVSLKSYTLHPRVY